MRTLFFRIFSASGKFPAKAIAGTAGRRWVIRKELQELEPFPLPNGKQLPPPDPRFGGAIRENASESTPWWPPPVVPPKGAPTRQLKFQTVRYTYNQQIKSRSQPKPALAACRT